MLTLAAMIGIDSIPIESFLCQNGNVVNRKKVCLIRKNLKLSVMAAFGYRKQKPSPKTRQSFEQVVEFIK
ncbi:hypothetical protein [Aggregatibacter kilianii]